MWTRVYRGWEYYQPQSSQFTLPKNRYKSYTLVELIFGYDTILTIKHKEDWELIRQKNQAQINKDNRRQNRTRLNHDYKVGDKLMPNIKAEYKYETQYKGPFETMQK